MNFILELISALISVFLIIFFSRKVDEELKQEIMQDTNVAIWLEEMNGIYYAWDKENSKFLCQSKQMEDIISHVRNAFPEKNFMFISDKEIEWFRTNEQTNLN